MKKTYIQPDIVVVKIDTMHMMCVSNATLDPNNTIGSASDFGARESDFDDEEW